MSLQVLARRKEECVDAFSTIHQTDRRTYALVEKKKKGQEWGVLPNIKPVLGTSEGLTPPTTPFDATKEHDVRGGKGPNVPDVRDVSHV